MRRLLLLVMAILSLAIVERASSQILFDENFNYTAGDSIGAHGWVYNTGTTNTILVATPGLTFTGYSLSGIGNQCHLANNGNDAYKQFTADSTGSFYTSFMVNLDSVKAGGDYFLAMLSSTSTTNYTARFYVKDSLNGVSFGCSKGTSASNTISWTPTTYALNTTYLIIIKYTFLTGTSTDDEIRVYIFNASLPGTEPGSPTLGPVTGPAGDLNNYSRVAIRQGSAAIAPTMEIDGFRVAKSWSNLVTGVTPLTTVAQNFSLSQNYPNPFNPSTKIDFSVPERSFVTMKVYDMLGKEVIQLVSGDYSAGTYSVDMNAKGLSSGMYLYSIEARSETGNIFKDTKKLTLVK
ncbi:MAG: T9SS type A sorting domain-containing protein [Ignavibacteria bacterium]